MPNLRGILTGISEETRSGKAVGSGSNTHDIVILRPPYTVVLKSMKPEPIHAEVDFGFEIETRWHNGGCGLTQSCIRW